MSDIGKTVGAVVIGRNEGERLEASLRSINPENIPVVYVDSGSTDDSVAHARARGCRVVELDLRTPFTAARARNEGYRHLLEHHPSLTFVQFIDGDCELNPTWLTAALNEMAADPRLAAVCGRRREKFPDATLYNRLIDMEWNSPIGDAKSCGGDALIRVEALKDVAGYDESFAAGEEPEMCFRMRRNSWKIRRIDTEMTLHDAALHRLAQWWTRNKRSGSAYAQGMWTHGRSQERYNVRESARIWIWAGVIPLGAFASAPMTSGWSLVGAAAGYGALLSKVAKYRLSRGDPPRDAWTYGAFNVVGKFPQLMGQMAFFRHRRSQLIEYKVSNSPNER